VTDGWHVGTARGARPRAELRAIDGALYALRKPNPSLKRTADGAGAPKTVLVLGLAGCAAEPGPKPSSSASEAAPYVGVFTGEFVDGKPLYRFPPIYVIGSRSSFGPDI